jgi:hypothetical protein
VEVTHTLVTVGGGQFNVHLARVPLRTIRVKVGLAMGRVGRSEPLADIARRYGAMAALNGCFFDAYTSNSIKNPHHTLITDGQVVHKGNVGSIMGFTNNGEARLGRLPLKIIGSLDGRYRWPDNWFAYWINRYPESGNTVTIFDRHWGNTTPVGDGIQVTVRRGVVSVIRTGSQSIPLDGFVVYLRGREKSLTERFRVGRRCEYRIVREDGTDLSWWGKVREGMGCGPTLVVDGRVTVDPVAEGFRHPKILSLSCARSAVGLTNNNSLLLVTCSGATIRQLAVVMKALGAREAMNLDGGASSGLWVEGKYLTTPEREISNALLVMRR